MLMKKTQNNLAAVGQARLVTTRLLVLVLMGLMAIGLVGCDGITGQNSSGESTEPTTLPPVLSEGFITTEGKVVPVRFANLSFTISGAIAEVLVEEGDFVAEGDLIARLEGKERLEAAIVAAELEVLLAEQARENLFDDVDLRKAEAQFELAEAERAVDQAQERLESKDFKKGSQDEIDAAWAEIVLAEKSVERAEEDFEEVEDKAENDFGRALELSRLAEARTRRDRAWTRYNALNEEPDALEIKEAEAELEVALKRLALAEDDWDELQDGLDADELALAESRLESAKAQLESTQLRLEDLELRAPFSGTIVVSDLEVGELINPGTVVLLADEDHMQIETTDLTELDVVGVDVGMPVEVNVDALPDVNLSGVVESIKILGETIQGDVTYQVVVALDEQDNRLRWNMTTLVMFQEE
jgi:HlyD family secretion protein